MENKKFWRWKKPDIVDEMSDESGSERMLFLEGVIAEESWFDDDVTPKMFKNELTNGTGNITVWINSPGGDCIAAAQIYNMLTEYKGKVTVFIDGLAASAASVIAMAGDEVVMFPVSLMMIHNPSCMAWGESKDLRKEAEMLDEVKESIINAYEIKTGLSRVKISHLMDCETWLNANKAVELGFADRINKDNAENSVDITDVFSTVADAFSTVTVTRRAVANALIGKIKRNEIDGSIPMPSSPEHSVKDIMMRLNYIKKHI